MDPDQTARSQTYYVGFVMTRLIFLDNEEFNDKLTHQNRR
jgi:hypothetical protein